MRFYIIIVIFLLMNAFFIISENDLRMNSLENVKALGSLYVSWIGGITDNLKSITGDVINSNWLPDSG